jgi:hypothetical protein
MYLLKFYFFIFMMLGFSISARSNSDDNNSDNTGENVQSLFRFATFNASLNRNNQGDLIRDLSTPDDTQAKNVAEIIQRLRPDILLINEFDYDADGEAAKLFQDNYLSKIHNGSNPITYPHVYVADSNTGVPSGFDLDNNGSVGGPGDALGFGFFPGQYAFVIYSKFPLDTNNVRTFQKFLWKDMPNAKLPKNPDGSSFYAPEELAIFRLSSKNHVDIPVQLPKGTVHVLAAHPTPPVFDGVEDRNGLRNYDEIRLFADYIDPSKSSYLKDDKGKSGGLAANTHFVILGDYNADPFDGDSTDKAALQLINHPFINQEVTGGALIPQSEGGIEFAQRNPNPNAKHQGFAGFDTAAFGPSAGGLRVDYVLPSANLIVENSGVFWPTPNDPFAYLVITKEVQADGQIVIKDFLASSDHRLVWVDVKLP